ncbi:cytoplasmic protein [Bacillus cereus]|nr:cytoplasmic protein [Bacillus cereus]
MEIKKLVIDGINIAVIKNDKVLISDVQTSLDLMATVQYEVDAKHIIIDKSLISEKFFDLKTRLAGDILQKFINYKVKIAIIGDFSMYTSKSLKDFIYECNKGKDIFYLVTEQQAIEKLSTLK